MSSIEMLLERLNNYCRAGDTIDNLKFYLSSQTEFRTQASCRLIGHLVDGSVHTFWWDSDTNVFSVGIGFVEGSGADLLRETYPNFDRLGAPHPEFVFDKCAEETLCLTATLYANEIVTGETLKNRFGGGYDIFIYSGEEFRRIEEVVYLYYSLQLTDVNTARCGLTPFYIKNFYFDEVGVVMTLLTDTSIMRNSDPHQRISVVRPSVEQHRITVPNLQISDLPLGASRIVVGVIGTHVSGQKEVFTAAIRPSEATTFKIYLTGKVQEELHEIRFDLSASIMNNIVAAACKQFTRPLAS